MSILLPKLKADLEKLSDISEACIFAPKLSSKNAKEAKQLALDLFLEHPADVDNPTKRQACYRKYSRCIKQLQERYWLQHPQRHISKYLGQHD
jgi:hypothetical protein